MLSDGEKQALLTEKFLQLLRLSIGSSAEEPDIAAEEWPEIHDMSAKQSLQALMFCGVERLPEDKRPPHELRLRWIVECQRAEMGNRKLNAAVVAVAEWFRKRGFRSCLLKGQGNAMMYPQPLRRMPGDIDLLLEGEPDAVIRFVHGIDKNAEARYHHIEFPSYKGIPVEIHYRPRFLRNPIHNHRLQKYFVQQSDRQFSNIVTTEDGSCYSAPTTDFNVIFQLSHIYGHLYEEGIGLRQLIDYYYLLYKYDKEKHDKSALRRQLKRMGMYGIAGAVMYILRDKLHIDESLLIVPADERRGRVLLDDIFEGGNFGFYSTRNFTNEGLIRHNVMRILRDVSLLRYFPGESLWEPFFRIWHFFWRRKHN